NLLRQRGFRRTKSPEHMAGDLAGAVLPPNPYSQPWIFPRAQVLLDGLQSVMSTAAAAGPQPQLPQRQIRIIEHYQHSREGDVKKIFNCRDGLTAGVHVRLRPAQNHPALPDVCPRYQRVELLLRTPTCLPALGQ